MPSPLNVPLAAAGGGDNMMGKWWKEMVALCLGLAAVGTIAWALGRQFFVTRDEWNSNREAMFNLQYELGDLKKTLKETAQIIKDSTASKEIDLLQRRVNDLENSRRPRRSN